MNKFNLQFGVGELCLPKLLSLNLLFILAMFLFGLSSCKKEQVNKTPLINVNKIAPTQTSAVYPIGSPVQINGKLKVTGKYLSNNCGYPIQLRGMSSHGAQWFSNCYNASALDALKNSW